ncbi:MAG: two-component regulator propeller domain-containing protein, partial [Verrucomicrobiota bacterium]
MPKPGFLFSKGNRFFQIIPALLGSWALANISSAAILWSDLGATLVRESGEGEDISGGLVRRDDKSTDTLYFKFHLDPLSDVGTEEYFAAFQLYEGKVPRLAVGNSLKAWAYSAFNSSDTGTNNAVSGDIDLLSARPEPSATLGVPLPYELPRRGADNTIVFKVQYLAGEGDQVTVWLNPDLGPGATEEKQSTNLTTSFTANASFNEIHLRHGGGGGGWTFSDMAIASSFSDFVTTSGAEPGSASGTGRSELPLIFRSWQREQGLPQNSVRTLAQTLDGYIWVGSEDGVARFDGLRFVSFGTREGLPGGAVNALCADLNGALWIATSGGGLTRWHDRKFSTLTTKDGLPSDSVTALAEDNVGQLWIGTEAGLVVWQDGLLSPVNPAEQFKGKVITTLFKDRKGAMWIGVKGAGVFSFADGKCVALSDGSVQGLLNDPHCLLVDRGGRIWVGAGDDFVLCRDGEQWHRYRIPRHLARPYVSALAEESDGTVWAGSVSEGLFQFKGGKLTAINASSGISDIFVQSLLVDHEGNLWVGTSAGLNRLRRGNLWVFGQNKGLGYGAVRGLAEISPGVILAGKPGDGLYRWNGWDFARSTSTNYSQTFLQVNSLLAAKDGSCWIAGESGLMKFNETDMAPFALIGKNVISLAAGPGGTIFAGTREGELWHWQDGNWKEQTNYSRAHPITAIVPEKDGALWIGTDGDGLYRFENGASAHFDKIKGLLSDSIRTLHLDSQGVLWIGTTGGGLGRYSEKRITNFTIHEGLPDNTISQILDDNSGRLWLGSNRGIVCVRKRELEEPAAGKIAIIYPQTYGRAEGMLSEECSSGFFPAGLKSKSGLLWFSTLKGVVVVDPRPNTAPSSPPNVLLEEVLLDGNIVPEWPAQSMAKLSAKKDAVLTNTET